MFFSSSHTHACIAVNHFNHQVDDEDQALKELRGIIEKLGGWPLLNDVVWNDSKWSLEGTIEAIRKHLLNRTDKIFDIASFITHIQNANNVRNVFIQFPMHTHTHFHPLNFSSFSFLGILPAVSATHAIILIAYRNVSSIH